MVYPSSFVDSIIRQKFKTRNSAKEIDAKPLGLWLFLKWTFLKLYVPLKDYLRNTKPIKEAEVTTCLQDFLWMWGSGYWQNRYSINFKTYEHKKGIWNKDI